MAIMVMKGMFKTEKIKMSGGEFHCVETGAPMNKAFTQTYTLKVGGEKIEVTDLGPFGCCCCCCTRAGVGAFFCVEIEKKTFQILEPSGKKVKVSAVWADDSKQKLKFVIEGEVPSIGYRFLSGGKMIVHAHCADKTGKLIGGDIRSVYERLGPKPEPQAPSSQAPAAPTQMAPPPPGKEETKMPK